METHLLNVSVFHHTSCGWPATKQVQSTVHVQSPFTVALSTLPTTRVKGHLSVSSSATSVVVGEALLVSSLLTSKVNDKRIHIHQITYVPNYNTNRGSMSELITPICSNKELKELKESKEEVIVLSNLEELTKCFIVRPLIVPSSGSLESPLGTIKVQWSTPSMPKQAASLSMNETSIHLPIVNVVDVQAVTAYIVAPTKCVLGKAFEMTLVVENRGKTVVPITFVVSLGGDFYCAGRTSGGHTVHPLSTSRTNFRLIGVKLGNVSLPGIVAEREGGEKLMEEAHTGRITCFP
jgi:hypothetical protein